MFTRVDRLEAHLYEVRDDPKFWQARFSWSVDGRTFSCKPRAVQIVAASSLEGLKAADYDLLAIALEATTSFYFADGLLRRPAHTRGLYWQVGVVDGAGVPVWSEPARLVLPPDTRSLRSIPWIALGGYEDLRRKRLERPLIMDLQCEQMIARVEFSVMPTHFHLEMREQRDEPAPSSLAAFASTPCILRGSKWAGRIETKAVRGRYIVLSDIVVPPGSLNGVPLEILITPEGRRGSFVFVVPEEYIVERPPIAEALYAEHAPDVLVKRVVRLDRPIKEAVITYTGLGYCHLFINGRGVSDDVLWPPFTNYTQRVYCRSLDVTEYLRAGDNVFGAALGAGFRSLPTPDIFGHQRCEWSAAPSFACELVVTHADGSTEVIRTGPDWFARTGSYAFNCLRGGETMNGGLDEAAMLGDASISPEWNRVQVVPAPSGRLLPDASLPITASSPIEPRRLFTNQGGTLTADFGRTLTGVVRFEATGRQGQRLFVRSNDTLYKDGSVDIGNCAQFTYGRFQVDVAVCSGAAKDRFEPRHSYKGFRYAEFLGAIETLDRASVRAVTVTNELTPAGSLDFTDQRLAALQAACVNTLASSLHGVPDDSTREKMGWLGENGLHSYGQFLTFQVHRLYRKWIFDMLDTENADGLIANMAPECGFWHRARAGSPPPSHNDPWWCGSLIVVAWNLYLFYRDRSILETIFPAAERLMGYILRHSKDGIVDWNLGDWLELDSKNFPQRTPIAITGTLGLKLLADRMAQIATVLGERPAAVRYRALARRTGAAFRRTFAEKYRDPAFDSQATWGLMLGLDVTPPAERAEMIGLLEANLIQRGGHLSTGSLGTLPVLNALGEYGRDGLLERLLTDETYPGYGYMLKQGATALWENWNGLESQCHVTYVGVHEFLHRSFGGLQPGWRPDCGPCLQLAPGRPASLGGCRIGQRQPLFEYEAEWLPDGDGLRANLTWRSESPLVIDTAKCRRRGETLGVRVQGVRRQPPMTGMTIRLPNEGAAELWITKVNR